jgi:RpiR family carbohydrate utilization transcriptional regulator
MDLGGYVFESIRLHYDEIFSAEKKVADYILKNPENSVIVNVSELAELCDTSDATVIRMCKHIGYKGFYQMKLQLAHDLGREQIFSGNILPKDPGNWEDVLKEIAANIMHSKANVNEDELMKCIDYITKCDTVHMVAAGNSIPSSIDFAFRLGRVGIRASSAFMPEHQLNSVNLGSDRDIVIGISHSGSAKQVLQAFELAKKRNMRTIAITDLLRTPIAKEADSVLSTGIEYSSVYTFGAASHVYISVLLDILLYFVARTKQKVESNGEADNVEFFLSETKI